MSLIGSVRLSLTDLPEFRKWRAKEPRMTGHLSLLDKQLGRFGIPYVLLKRTQDLELLGLKPTKSILEIYSQMKMWEGLGIGILWAIQNAPKGIVLLGSVDMTYHHKLFKQV